MKEKELDMNELIRDFNEYSTDYIKTACDYYKDYLINYQKEKIQLETNWKELKKWLEEEQNINFYDISDYTHDQIYNSILSKMQELEGNNE